MYASLLIVFRMGKSLEMIQAAKRALRIPDGFLKIVVPLAKIGSSLYLFCDHLIWLAKMRLWARDEQYWSRQAFRFWLFSLIMALMRDAYELVLDYRVESQRLKTNSKTLASSSSSAPTVPSTLSSILYNHKALILDVTKNSADIFIPLDRLGLVSLPSGVVGLMGTMSSLIGLYTDWDEQAKLKYS